MWSAEQCREWAVVGRALGLALLLGGGAAIPASLWLVRRIQPSRQRRAILVFVAVALVAPLVFLLLRWVAPRVFLILTCKEGWVELATLFVLIMAAAVFFDGARTGRIRGWGYVWAGLCVLVLLEEIDWGQLIWNFDTPGWVLLVSGRTTNLNFHNTGTSTVIFLVGILTVFVGLPVAVRMRRLAPRLASWGLQAPAVPVFAAVLGVVFGINSLGTACGLEAQLQEITECSLALLLWAYAQQWWWAAESGP